jgi:hypothetical protein
MNGDDLIDAVRDEQQTELSRLGSSKALYADTRGELEPETVRAAAAAREATASETFGAWADGSGAGELFADAATEAEDRLGDTEPADWTPAMHEVLDSFETTVERLGGFVGWTLVDTRLKDQLTGFFTGQADPQTASTYRSAGTEIERIQEDAVELLDEVCADEQDWDDAQAAAIAVVSAAYDEYFETLEDLGVNPKPVC